MNPSTRFRLSGRGLLLAMISTAFAGSTWAENARVEFAIGNVTATGSDGRLRQLARNAEVGSGDLIRTNNNGQVQIRYPDGAYVSLRPDTEYAIREYQFEGKTDGSEKGFFSLLKGTMRTVTGLVGRVNKRSYQIATPTATIGIRGTGGVISVDNLGNTSLFGTSGTWDVTPNTGGPTTPVNPGEKSTTTPTGTQKSDSSGSGGSSSGTSGKGGTAVGGSSDTPIYSNGNDTTSTGAPAILGQEISPANAVFVIQAGGISGTTSVGSGVPSSVTSIPGALNVDAKFSGTALSDLIVTASGSSSSSFTLHLSGTLADGGSDGAFSWGRIVGTLTDTTVGSSSSTITTFSPNQGFHYAVGPAATAMPTGGSFSYVSIGGTNPTFASGSTAPGSFNSASFSGSFAPTGGTINNITLEYTINGAVYDVRSGSTSFSGVSFTALTSAQAGSGPCSGGCTTNITGAFSGAGGSHAGMVYQTIVGSDNINGAVGLVKQ